MQDHKNPWRPGPAKETPDPSGDRSDRVAPSEKAREEPSFAAPEEKRAERPIPPPEEKRHSPPPPPKEKRAEPPAETSLAARIEELLAEKSAAPETPPPSAPASEAEPPRADPVEPPSPATVEPPREEAPPDEPAPVEEPEAPLIADRPLPPVDEEEFEDEEKERGLFGWILVGVRFAAWALVVFIIGSTLWVGAYRFIGPPGTFTMLERKLSGDVIIHPWTPLERISPNLVRAVLAGEDSRFCLHDGLDFVEIEKAVAEAERGGRRRGASTISQQTAKNAFLWNGGGWLRKGAEAWFTVVMEAFWPKRRVMEVYLNVAEWGNGYFGAEAAARARFKKSAKDLTPYEAALLAAVLPSPNKWRADNPGPYVRGRASMLRGRMEQVRRDGLDACIYGKR
jgi:monofunctional biosynthetic peptidoglycan transglycosylase